MSVAASATVGELVQATKPDSLEAVARVVGANPDAWGPVAGPDPAGRTYTCIYRDDDIEVWVLGWCKGQATDLHDHDGCAGAVYVVEGEVIEDRVSGIVADGIQTTAALASATESFAFDGTRIHRVGHAGVGPAMTVHVYSPPIRRMGYYELAPDGSLTRFALDHTDESFLVGLAG